MKRLVTMLLLFALVMSVMTVPATAAPEEKSYIVIATGSQVPSTLSQEVNAAGGTITDTIPEIGVAVVTSSNASFKVKASKFRGVKAVVPNLRFQMVDPVPAVAYEAIGN